MTEAIGYIFGAVVAACGCWQIAIWIQDERRTRELDALHGQAYRDAHSGGPHA